MRIPFHRPILPKSLDEIYQDSIRSGWLTTAKQVQNFEGILSEYLNANYVIAVNSCTAALHLGLAAMGFRQGDKFIVPTMTFVSTIESGEYLGMKPILVDNEKSGFLIDLNNVEDILKTHNNIKAILPVHYGGEPVNMVELFNLAEKYGVFILEDAAHALESKSNAGKIGDTNYGAAFSFYANKNITTGGEGGAFSTNDNDLAEKVRKLSLHGITRDGWSRFKDYGKWEYDIVELGFKYNMTDISASIGLWQFRHLNKWQEKRQTVIKQYCEGLNDIKGIQLPKIYDGHAKHLFVIKLNLDCWKISRNSFIDKMNKKGIGLAVHYKPIHQLSYYKKKYDFSENNFPCANELFKKVISLPLYPDLSPNEINYIIKTIKELYDRFSI